MRSGLVLLVVLGLSLAMPARAADNAQDFPTIERGRYLATLGDCAACHTLPGSGHDFAGGRPIATPFGNMLAPNITPDRATGIGAWTEEEFAAVLTKGRGWHGEHLYPAMPFTAMTKMPDDDIRALRAYLNTVPPVRNEVVANQLKFPFDIRWAMALWDFLFFKPGTFVPQPERTAEWNRGAYLVEGPMHCGTCHTPKNFLGADRTSEALTGYSLQGWFAPDLTGNPRTGLGGWSMANIVAYLKNGHNQMTAASGPMGEEVAQSSSKLTDSDLQAIATYLKSLPPSTGRAATALDAGDARMKAGAAIYADECSACHKPDGTGVIGLFPALAGSAAVQSREATSLLHVVIAGTRSVGTSTAPTAPAMPPFGQFLSDDQVAKVLTYIRNAWGNAAAPVDAGDAAGMRQELHDHPSE